MYILNSVKLFLRPQSNLKFADDAVDNYDLFSYVKNSFGSGTYHGIT